MVLKRERSYMQQQCYVGIDRATCSIKRKIKKLTLYFDKLTMHVVNS